MTIQHFEEISTGKTHTCGAREVTRQEIIDFAEQYDPQQFHINEAAAEKTMFGGLIASGWHTAAVCMRLLVDSYLSDIAVVGALGVDEIRWSNPVRPGDELTVEVTPISKESWDDSKGLVELAVNGYNQDSDEVLARTDRVLIERRSPDN